MQFARYMVVAGAFLATANADAHGKKNIVETAVAANFTILAEALTAANLITTLSGDGPFTVFAPTDAAFEAAMAALGATKEQLLNHKDLAGILTYHVVSGTVKSTDLTDGMEAATVQGAKVKFAINGTTVKVNTATVTAADVMCSNGVIHIIDGVLMPPMADAPAADAPAADAPAADEAPAADAPAADAPAVTTTKAATAVADTAFSAKGLASLTLAGIFSAFLIIHI